MEDSIKYFRGFLIALYVIIVVGSIANYSSQYNGQPVFSPIGILDNFLISAILPLIIYGIGLLIRKLFFNKNQFSYMAKPEEISDTNPEDSAAKKPMKIWPIALALGVAILVVSIAYNIFFPEASTTEQSQSTNTVSNYDNSWIPTGFSGYPENDNVAWRWGTSAETNCSYSSGSCWSVMLITREGCPNSMYGELAIFDRLDVQIDYTNASTTRVLPDTRVKLTFNTFNEEADTARLSEVTCR